MQRNYLRGLLICLIPCLVAAVFAVRPDKYRLGIDLAGGTILVYEINLERTKQRNARRQAQVQRPAAGRRGREGLDSEEMKASSPQQIKRRIDPTDIKNVTVRPLGRTPGRDHPPHRRRNRRRPREPVAEEIEEVKRLISQMGVLEFRILANGPDDAEGIIAARAAIDKQARRVAPRQRARPASPPVGPEGEFTVGIDETSARVRYAWVELGKEERESSGLTNASEGRVQLWAQAAAERSAGQAFLLGGGQSIVQDTSQAHDGPLQPQRPGASSKLQSEQTRTRAASVRENPGWSDEEDRTELLTRRSSSTSS